MAPKPPPSKFDQAKFQQMQEPFTVRVERIEGNRKEYIPLPPKDGYNVGGPGWSAEEVLALEQWIAKDWSGGGTYLFQITDSSQPPQTMEWAGVFPYPKKVPPIMQDTATPPPVVAQPQPMMSSGAPWPPPGAQPWQGYAPAPAPQPYGAPYGTQIPFGSPYGAQVPFGPYGASYGYPGYPPPFPPPASTAVKPKDELEALRIENEKLRLAQQEERHQAQMKMQEDQHRREMDAIRTEMRNLAAATTAKPAGESEETRLLRERLEREREERRAAEQKAAEDRHRAELAALAAKVDAKPATDPAIAILQAKMEADERRREEDRRLDDLRRQQERETQALRDELRAVREQPKGPDPVMMMVVEQLKQANESQKEIARLNAERDREIARSNADALRELKTQMVHPAEMFRMVRDASSGQDQIITSTVSTLNSVFNTAQQWMNSVMQQMGGGGESPVVRLLEGGMAQVQDMAKRWMETKAQRDVASSNAQREQAKAAAAQAAAFTAAHQPAWQPPPPVAGAGVSSPPAAAPVAQPSNGTSNGNGAGLNGAAAANGNGKPAAAPASKMRKGGKTDEEWFGPALPDVEALRAHAMTFQQSALAKPPILDENGMPKGIGPDQAAMFILQASQVIEQEKLSILAFEKLFAQEMYADLVDILLPDLIPGYREDVVKFLFKLLNGEPLDTKEIAAGTTTGATA